ncbi:hypothetical protein CEXT_316281 [Caerostris extrusa]|uniref:Uncharacterized protein n=1 Tax=Caerostris extrusa TaxID=172846 RepID=A0AAV4VL52_CAEEX|nr:hypothetical protein CEXT_316281 [Caerostris extrusa]
MEINSVFCNLEGPKKDIQGDAFAGAMFIEFLCLEKGLVESIWFAELQPLRIFREKGLFMLCFSGLSWKKRAHAHSGRNERYLYVIEWSSIELSSMGQFCQTL